MVKQLDTLSHDVTAVDTKRKRKWLIGVTAGIVGLGLAATGFNAAGAYFSDTKDGNVSGTLGSIHISSDNTNVSFDGLLPGEPQTVSVNYTNSGSSKQDVWLVFPNATALSALNNLGTYGEIHIQNNNTAVFDSANLNDRSSSCGAFAPDACWPVPQKIKLASNVASGNGGALHITFNYASKLKTQAPAGTTGVFNAFPVPGQTTVNVADGTGNGLPFQLVATQVGQQP